MFSINRFFLVGLTCFLTLFSTGQVKVDKPYLKSYWTDTKYTASEPFRWQKKDWLVFSGVAATTTVLFFLDDEIQSWSQENRNEQTEFVSTYLLEPWGSGLYTFGALGALYLFEGEKGKTVALQSTKAWVLTAGATVVLKQLFHRQRPNEGAYPDPYSWHGPYALTQDNTSFPSGHTSTVFAVATVISKSYTDKKWVPWVSYSIATLTGLSRIHDNEHWASDVFVGAALGYFVGHCIVKNQSNIDWGVGIHNGKPSGSLQLHF